MMLKYISLMCAVVEYIAYLLSFTLSIIKYNFKVHTFYFLIVFLLSKNSLRSTVQHFMDDF